RRPRPRPRRKTARPPGSPSRRRHRGQDGTPGGGADPFDGLIWALEERRVAGSVDRDQDAVAPQRELGVRGERHAAIVLAPQYECRRRILEWHRAVRRKRTKMVQEEGLA